VTPLVTDNPDYMKIIIETETPNDSATMFRVLLDDKIIGEGLTAVQAQLVVAEIIERLVVPRQLKPGPVALGYE
jgi:hypothetical protein